MTPSARLISQRLIGSEFTKPVEAVRWLGAIQGQDLASAVWSIGLRIPGSTLLDVERAFSEGKIVRTWTVRGTLHVVAAEDVRWMVELTGPSNSQRATRRHRELELDEKTLAKGRNTLQKALEKQHLTREEVFASLQRAKISTEGQRGYHLLWDAAVHGLICSGAPRGKEQTFALIDEWIPKTKPKSREEAIAELARRYFQSRAPATLKDFAWWAGLSQREARQGFGELESVPPSPTASSAFALPAFDEYLLGYQDRSSVLDARFAKRIFPGGGTFIPSLVLDGKVVGSWKRATLEFETFTNVKKQPLEEALQRYGDFISATKPPSRRARSAD
jgi:hypothetical protein